MTPEERARAAMDRFPSLRKAPDWSVWVEMRQAIQAEIVAATAEAREKCAKICEEADACGTLKTVDGEEHFSDNGPCGRDLAAAIRAQT